MTFDEETCAALDILMSANPTEPWPALPNWRDFYNRSNADKAAELDEINPNWRLDHLEGVFDEHAFLSNTILTRKYSHSYLIHTYSLFGAQPVANPGSIAGRLTNVELL